MIDPTSDVPPSDPRRDGIYRTILWVLVANVMLGAVLTVAGESFLNNPALSRVGFGMAIIGAVLYAVFRWLGAKEANRRRQKPDDEAAE